MEQLIDDLTHAGHRVTIYDTGISTAEFVLAVVIDEPIDIWYVASIVGTIMIQSPMIVGKVLVFPDKGIDSTLYDYICAKSRS
jgi:hypothetical protein